jgi:ATP-binding cassette subfamily B multidrug efflux pump
MFRLFEKALDPTQQPARPEPPARLVAFYWHFARQAKGLFVALFVIGFLVAVLDSMIPVFMGRVVGLVTSSDPARLWDESWPTLLGMAAVLLMVRPLALTGQNLVANQAISANVSNMIRWQNHWHVARQSWAFFQNDSPAASLPGYCRPGRRCASRLSPSSPACGTSWFTARARLSCSLRLTFGSRCRSRCGF